MTLGVFLHQSCLVLLQRTVSRPVRFIWAGVMTAIGLGCSRAETSLKVGLDPLTNKLWCGPFAV